MFLSCHYVTLVSLITSSVAVKSSCAHTAAPHAPKKIAACIWYFWKILEKYVLFASKQYLILNSDVGKTCKRMEHVTFRTYTSPALNSRKFNIHSTWEAQNTVCLKYRMFFCASDWSVSPYTDQIGCPLHFSDPFSSAVPSHAVIGAQIMTIVSDDWWKICSFSWQHWQMHVGCVPRDPSL